jgi:hypothetical protein
VLRPAAFDIEHRHRIARRGIAAAAALSVLAALLMGGMVVKIAAIIVSACVLQGLWAGAARLVGVVAALLVAGPLALLLGRSLEGPLGALIGTSGLLARFASMAIVATVVVIAGAAVSRSLSRRILDRWPGLHAWDRYVGAALGLAEGCLVALMVLWAPLVLEPIARAQLLDGTHDPREAEWALTAEASARPRRHGGPATTPPPLATGIVALADRVHESSLGGIIERTNPVTGSTLLSLIADFAAVTRDPDAMAWLLRQPVMDRIEALPSVRDAVERLKDDPDLSGYVGEQGQIDAAAILAFLESPEVLELMDRTTVVRDMMPLARELTEAIRQARSRVRD